MNLPYQPDLQGKVAVITGGAGVLCREFAKALAQCGAKVAILNRTLAKAEQVAEDIRAQGFEAAAFQVEYFQSLCHNGIFVRLYEQRQHRT